MFIYYIQDRARGGCKKGKKCKKGNGKKNNDDDDEEANDNDEPEPTTETLDNDNGLMFDDDFDATDAPLQAMDYHIFLFRTAVLLKA